MKAVCGRTVRLTARLHRLCIAGAVVACVLTLASCGDERIEPRRDSVVRAIPTGAAELRSPESVGSWTIGQACPMNVCAGTYAMLGFEPAGDPAPSGWQPLSVSLGCVFREAEGRRFATVTIELRFVGAGFPKGSSPDRRGRLVGELYFGGSTSGPGALQAYRTGADRWTLVAQVSDSAEAIELLDQWRQSEQTDVRLEPVGAAATLPLPGIDAAARKVLRACNVRAPWMDETFA